MSLLFSGYFLVTIPVIVCLFLASCGPPQNGQGTFEYDDDGSKYSNGIYVGEWKDGKRHGRGTFTWADGAKYVGEYVGEWKDDKPNGRGEWTSPYLPVKYVGEYKDGKRHGQGSMNLADGGTYVGQWENHNFHGQGTYTYVNGDKYVGEFKDGKQHGQGTFTDTNGNKYVGKFRNDWGWNVTIYDKDGNVAGSVSEGVSHCKTLTSGIVDMEKKLTAVHDCLNKVR